MMCLTFFEDIDMFYKFSKYVRLIYYKRMKKCYIYSSVTKKEVIITNNSVNIVLKLVKGVFINEERELIFCERLLQLGFLIKNEGVECKFVEIYGDKPLNKIQIELTKTCNLKCKHCYIEDKSINANNCYFLDLERCKSFINDCITLGLLEVNLTGGEIFLVSYLMDLISYIKSENLKLRLYTNGILLDDEYIKKLEKYRVDYVKVSLDSVCNYNLLKIRGIKNTNILFDNLILLSNSSIKLEITTVVMSYNIKEISKIIEFVETKLRAKHYIDAYIPNFRNKTDPLYISEFDFAKIVSKRKNLKWNREILSYCGIGTDFLYIDCHGCIKKCPLLYKENYNLYEYSIDYIWENIKSKIICEKYYNCKYSSICGGGCRARAYNLTGNIYAEDKYCCRLFEILDYGGKLND